MNVLTRRTKIGLFAMVAVLTVVTSSTVAVFASHQFSDVGNGSWVHPSVTQLGGRRLRQGLPRRHVPTEREPDPGPVRLLGL